MTEHTYNQREEPEMTTSMTHQQIVDATREASETMERQKVPINVYETPSSLVVVAPFPTVQPDDVTVELTGSILRLSGELRSAGPREYLVREWLYGGYEREVELPQGFGSGVEASLSQGQLAIRVRRGEPTSDTITIHPTATALAVD